MTDAKKIVLKLDLHDDKTKQKAMKAVSGLIGLDKIDVDMKSEKMVLIGSLDPVVVVKKLKKAGQAPRLETVGPAAEKKKDEPKKAEAKKEEPRRLQQELRRVDPMVDYINSYNARYPYYTQHYYVRSVEEDPNACVIS